MTRYPTQSRTYGELMRDTFTTIAELAGAVLVTAGAAFVALPVALVVAGVFCLTFGYMGGRR